jgi:hypothetical protein
MVEKSEGTYYCKLISYNAKLWAERHVQLTWHNVQVSFYYDCADENWVEKLTPERRAELDEDRNAETAQAIAQSLLSGLKH